MSSWMHRSFYNLYLSTKSKDNDTEEQEYCNITVLSHHISCHEASEEIILHPSQHQTELRWSWAPWWGQCCWSSSCWSSSASCTGSWATDAATRRSSPTRSGTAQKCSSGRDNREQLKVLAARLLDKWSFSKRGTNRTHTVWQVPRCVHLSVGKDVSGREGTCASWVLSCFVGWCVYVKVSKQMSSASLFALLHLHKLVKKSMFFGFYNAKHKTKSRAAKL